MVPVTSVIAILLIWALVALPLCVVGTILGRNWAGQYRQLPLIASDCL
jgi:hypothetical protein